MRHCQYGQNNARSRHRQRHFLHHPMCPMCRQEGNRGNCKSVFHQLSHRPPRTTSIGNLSFARGFVYYPGPATKNFTQQDDMIRCFETASNYLHPLSIRAFMSIFNHVRANCKLGQARRKTTHKGVRYSVYIYPPTLIGWCPLFW